MLISGQTKIAKEEFYSEKESIKIWDADVDNKVISKLVETKRNSGYFIGYLDEVVRPLVLRLSKMTGFVKTFKNKGAERSKNNELMFLHIDNDKLFQKYKTIWTEIEDLKEIELSASSVYDKKCCIIIESILSEGIGPAKSINSKECMFCWYWFFNHGFKYQDSLCNGCLNLLMQCVNISDIAIIAVKGADYRYTIHDISKSDAPN